MNLVFFAPVSPSVRSTDIKLQEFQRNMSKMTGCLIKLLSQLPNILQTKGTTKMRSWRSLSGHANQNIVSIRKKFMLSGVSSEYKDLPRFAKDTDSHLFEEELEESLMKAKGRRHSFQALKPKPPAHASTKRKFSETSKNGRPTKRPMAGHKHTM